MPLYYKIFRYFSVLLDALFIYSIGAQLFRVSLYAYEVDIHFLFVSTVVILVFMSSLYLTIQTFKFGSIISEVEDNLLLDGEREPFYSRFKFDKFIVVINILLGISCMAVIFLPAVLSNNYALTQVFAFLIIFIYGASKVAFGVWVMKKINNLAN